MDVTTDHTPKSLRVRLDLTQAQVAERATEAARQEDSEASVSSQTVMRLEAGENVALDSFRWIATALGVTRETLHAAHDVVRARGAA